MKIEAVVVCVNYGDLLAWTLPHSRMQFDKLVVVTDDKDQQTRDLCEHYHVQCICTTSFYAGARSFVKSNGINHGLAALDRDGWVVHLDADIVLPPRTRGLLEAIDLDEAALYGCDRVLCGSFEAYMRHLAWPEVQHSVNAFIQANDFKLGGRVGRLAPGGDGWAPIGFFQMWNPGVSHRIWYPDHGTADRSDLAFAHQWPRSLRHLLPEFLVTHLAEDGKQDPGMGINWTGRKAPRFGPKPFKRKIWPRHHVEPPMPQAPVMDPLTGGYGDSS